VKSSFEPDPQWHWDCSVLTSFTPLRVYETRNEPETLPEESEESGLDQQLIC